MYPEEVADEIQSCIAQVDCEFGTKFNQFVAVASCVDIQTKDGEWFRVKVEKMVK